MTRDESQERVLTAVPMYSPCGRSGFHPSLGPSAIPTDQMMVFKTQVEDVGMATAQGAIPTSSMSMSMDSSVSSNLEYRSHAEASLSGDYVPTAVPIGSPCGRTKLHVPLGPSAIPTDQIVILDAQTTTGDSLGSTTTEFSAAAESNDHSTERLVTASPIGTPCGRTKFRVPLGPSAIPTDQILKFEQQRTVVPDGLSPLRSAVGKSTDFISPIAASGTRPLIDQWNLARNDNSDTNVSNRKKTACEPSEVKVQPSGGKTALSNSPLSPIANTARLPSGDSLFKESEVQMDRTAAQQKLIDQMLKRNQSGATQETTPEGLPQVEVIKLWPRDGRHT
ncbi:unnamed protein product [Strongylus vulgaris]|uniref:Uncharacterized protein n=1 Tax=Strongylus vulgaris TaxID=40348 RepID=A0A3P7IV78_STRVU|nr:unnamed protein product [Strongylus vulgaris]